MKDHAEEAGSFPWIAAVGSVDAVEACPSVAAVEAAANAYPLLVEAAEE